jgi:glutaredoxin-like protein NrdH
MAINHIDGNDKGQLMLYTLSTCGWCKKTKALLQELNVAFDFMEVDTLDKEARASTLEEIKKWNPACTFPSLIVNNESCIVGFKETKLRELFTP